jgi:hypothetical protein
LDEAGNPSQSDPIGSLKTGALIPDAEKRPWAKIMQIIGALNFAQSFRETRYGRSTLAGGLRQDRSRDSREPQSIHATPIAFVEIYSGLFNYNDTRPKDRIYGHNKPRAPGGAGHKHRLTTFPPRLEPETEWYYDCTNHYCVART